MEEWRPVSGYEGLYSVSSTGRVRNDRRGTTLSERRNSEGYARVALSRDGSYRHFVVHRLVAKAYIPNPTNKPLVLHGKNGNQDNSVGNLRWGTHKENMADRFRDGTDTRSLKAECVNGHAYTDRNTYWNPKTGSRSCKTCRYEHTKKYQEKRRAHNGNSSD